MNTTITATNPSHDYVGGFGAGLGKFLALQRREFADHRVAFFWAPILVAGLIILGLTAVAVQVSLFDGDLGEHYINIDGDIIIEDGVIEIEGDRMTVEEFKERFGEKFSEKFEEKREKITAVIAAVITSPLLMILPFMVIFPLLSSLYDERMDRSFLFWKSMPVSDTLEVLSKLCFIVVVGPMMIFLLMAVVNIAAALIATPVLWIYGFSAWDFIWGPTPFAGLWLGYAFNYLIYAAWALPVLAWLMLASAVAPKAPLLMATIPIGAVIIFEQVFFRYSYLAEALGNRLGREFGLIVRDTVEQSDGGMSVQIMDLGQAGEAFLDTVVDPSFWIGTLVAVGILYGAILLRRFRV